MNRTAKQLLAASLLVGLGASVFFTKSASSNSFGGGAFGGAQVGTTGAPTFTSTQSDGGAAFVVPTGQRVCLNGSTCTVYASYDGGTIGFAGAEPEGPSGLLRNNTALEDDYANTFVAGAIQADGGTGKYGFMCNQLPCYWKLSSGSQREIYADNDGIHLTTATYLPTTFVQAIAADPQGADILATNTGGWWGENPQGSVPTCDSGGKGGRATLSSDGRSYYCDGTTAQKIGFILSNTATIDFASMNTQTTDTQTMTVTGALTSDWVHCAPVSGGSMSGTDMHSTVTSADTVTILAHNDTNGTVDPPSMSIKCVIVR